MIKRRTVHMHLLIIVLLKLIASCRADSSSIRKGATLQRRLDGDTYEGGATRILIQPFSVVLAGASKAFTSSDLNALYKTMDQVVYDYVLQTKTVDNVSYLLLGDISSSKPKEGSIDLHLNTGVLKMDASSSNTPDEATLNAWIAEAINKNFVKALQDTPYPYLTEAKYAVVDPPVSDEEGASTDDKVGTDDREASGIIDEPASTVTTKSPSGVIVGACVGAATVVGLLAMLLVKRDKRSTGYIEQQNSKDETAFPDAAPRDMQDIFVATGRNDDKRSPSGLTLALSQIHQSLVSNSSGLSSSTSSTDHSDPTPAIQIVSGKPGILGAAPMILDDGRSLDGNESDFTVNTEAGDSTAVKSLPTQKLHRPTDIVASVERESFERDRQVCIRKDMMTSTWSGNTQHPPPPQNESVLEPSHLTASQARQEQRPRDEMLVIEHGGHDGSSKPNPASQVSRMARFGDAV
ncbi:hypothetical protein MPSEU_000331900 [Mayamaea pseudoterrestris]|nr:hypothetical protein MPSEU_000331900 [Mayamaea pseudoterrestris]